MTGPISDETFAGYIRKHAIVTDAQVEAARQRQSRSAADGGPSSLADALIALGFITATIKENVELKLQAQQKGIQQLLRYKLLRRLGEGAMGAVYLAEDTAQGRKVALKVLKRQFAGNADFMKRFQREADATGRLNHPNIVRAHSVGEDQGWHFFVMEYVDGETLDYRLKRDGFVPHAQALDILVQVTRGLEHAHALGILHRDIKPANIIMAGGVAKILDLGLSKSLDGNEQTFLTQSGVAMGTPHYMSPEQARGDKDVDGRSDLYSLGATLYHLLTGDTPFHGSSMFDVVTKHMSMQIPDPRDIREEIPEGMVRVIRRMMAKDREDRYASCTELLQDLDRVARGLEPSSRSIEAAKSSVALPKVSRHGAKDHATPVPPHAAKPPRAGVPGWVPFAVGGGLVLAILVPALVLTLGGKPKRAPAAAGRPVAPPKGGPGDVASPPPVDPAPTPPVPEENPVNAIRESVARDQLRDLQEREANGRYGKDELMAQYEGLATSYGDTGAGRKAREIADRMKAGLPSGTGLRQR
jgi:eukaryotic-like serine/threonine-protein kinase